MSYLLARHADVTLLADDPILPPGEIDALADAAALIARLDTVQAEAAARGRAAGYADGHGEGLDAATFAILELHREAEAWRARLCDSIADLAVAALRRIAAEIGEPALVRAIVHRVIADRVDRPALRVRVAIGVAAALEASGFGGDPAVPIDIVADPALAGAACIIESAFDVADAGFEVQLAAIQRAWADLVPSLDKVA